MGWMSIKYVNEPHSVYSIKVFILLKATSALKRIVSKEMSKRPRESQGEASRRGTLSVRLQSTRLFPFNFSRYLLQQAKRVSLNSLL